MLLSESPDETANLMNGQERTYRSDGVRSYSMKSMFCFLGLAFCVFFGSICSGIAFSMNRSYNNKFLTNFRIDNIIVQPSFCCDGGACDFSYPCFIGVLELSNATLSRYCGAMIVKDVNRTIVDTFIHERYKQYQMIDFYYEVGAAFCSSDRVLWTESFNWYVTATVIFAVLILIFLSYFARQWWKERQTRRHTVETAEHSETAGTSV